MIWYGSARTDDRYHVAIVSGPSALVVREDSLWERALQLPPEAVADIGERAGDLASEGCKGDGALMGAAIEHFEQVARPLVRQRRRPESQMPDALAATEEQRWSDPALRAVSEVVDRR